MSYSPKEIVFVDDDEEKGDVSLPSSSTASIVKGQPPTPVKTPLSSIISLNVKQLQALCKERKLKYTGLKKAELQELLVHGKVGGITRAPATTAPSKHKRQSKAAIARCDANARALVTKLIDKGYLNIATLEIHKNDKGLYEYKDTGLIFHPVSKKVNAKMSKDGETHPLNKHDIELCISNNLPFEVPENMNHGLGDKNIKGLEELKTSEELDDSDFHSEEEEESEGESEDDDL